MPLPAVLVTVTAAERRVLKKRIRGARTAWRDRLRAQIVLAAAMGRSTARIARDLRISQDTARKWRGRFADRGLEGLSDLPRPGRPRQISAQVRAAVVALACQLPAVTGVPLAHWTGPELAAELAARGLASPMSASSVLRILAEHPVKPWQYQSWIYPRDPDFEARAKVIVDLYQGYYQGTPLRPGTGSCRRLSLVRTNFHCIFAGQSCRVRVRDGGSRVRVSAWWRCWAAWRSLQPGGDLLPGGS